MRFKVVPSCYPALDQCMSDDFLSDVRMPRADLVAWSWLADAFIWLVIHTRRKGKAFREAVSPHLDPRERGTFYWVYMESVVLGFNRSAFSAMLWCVISVT